MQSSIGEKATNLKKAVMKQLLDIKSPSSTKKRQRFKKLSKNDAGALTVIDLAIEMDSSIEDTKVMIMNNCLE